MRNAISSADSVAEAAGTSVFEAGGNAADAVIAAMFAGAARGSSSALLGSGVVMVAGAGVGAFVVDGRARAPGLGAKRPTSPVNPPREWRAGVPGLLEGALAAHNRFGSIALSGISRAAVSAVADADGSQATRARLSLLEMLPRSGMSALERLGVLHAILEVAGPAAGGVITRDDLALFVPPVSPLEEISADLQQILVIPDDVAPRFAPPPLPSLTVGSAIAADLHGVIACAVWALPDEAIVLGSESGLALPALSNAPTKGITRRRPGSLLPIPVASGIIRSEGRVWAGVTVSGEGDLVSVRDRAIAGRLAAVGVKYPREASAGESMRGIVTWLIRDASGDVRSIAESHGA